MAIDLKLIDELLKNYKKPEDIIGEGGLLKQLTKAVDGPRIDGAMPRPWVPRSSPTRPCPSAPVGRSTSRAG